MIELLDPIIKSHNVEISNGLNVHYLEADSNKSQKPTALLLHGFPELSFSWRKILPLLSKDGFKVIAIDQCKNTTTILNQLENIESYPADFTELPPHDKEINVVYSRFTMHSIAEVEENNTLKWVFDNLENHEKKIFSNLDTVKRKFTSIMVAHRKSSLVLCDKIYEIKNQNINVI